MVPVFSRAPSKPCSKTMNTDGFGRRSGAAPLSGGVQTLRGLGCPWLSQDAPWQAPCRLSSPAFTLVVSWPVGMLAGSGHQNSPRSVNYVLLAATDIPD